MVIRQLASCKEVIPAIPPFFLLHLPSSPPFSPHRGLIRDSSRHDRNNAHVWVGRASALDVPPTRLQIGSSGGTCKPAESRDGTCSSCATARARAGPEQLKAEEVTRHFYKESRGQVDGMNTEAGR